MHSHAILAHLILLLGCNSFAAVPSPSKTVDIFSKLNPCMVTDVLVSLSLRPDMLWKANAQLLNRTDCLVFQGMQSRHWEVRSLRRWLDWANYGILRQARNARRNSLWCKEASGLQVRAWSLSAVWWTLGLANQSFDGSHVEPELLYRRCT